MDNTGDGSSLGDILTELSSLKERNQSMETELKELQERYSDMSLKFAEVEGERQKLVMTVRSLKNARKGWKFLPVILVPAMYSCSFGTDFAATETLQMNKLMCGKIYTSSSFFSLVFFPLLNRKCVP